MLQWMVLPFRRYFDFSGRSRRKEYWSFQLLNWLILLSTVFLAGVGGTRTSTSSAQTVDGVYTATTASAMTYGPLSSLAGILLAVWVLGSFIPSLALSVRRIHDRDKSGLYLLLPIIPLVGLVFAVIILIDMFRSGTVGTNRYGEDPKGPDHADVFS